MLMMSFKEISLGQSIESFAAIATDDTDPSERTQTVKIAKILEKSQHNLGEYSSEDIMRTKIEDYNN